MGLGDRHAVRHETVGWQKHAVVSADYADFAVEQRVMTRDGFPGIVTAVLDGPYPGTEAYDVTLDNGMGGGMYTTSQLQPIGGTTASHEHEGLASADYPELGSILHDRPDIAREG